MIGRVIERIQFEHGDKIRDALMRTHTDALMYGTSVVRIGWDAEKGLDVQAVEPETVNK